MTSPRALSPEVNARLRQRIRDLIASRYGGTARDAARALGVSHATISDVLSGNRGVGHKLLSGLADVTGLSIDVLMGREQEPDPAEHTGDCVRHHPRFDVALLEFRALLARRGVPVDESAVVELSAIGLSRSRPHLTGAFLRALYEAVLQDREDNAGDV